ncbi:MAG: CopG family transcriptional regulator [Candidatus Eisenbacteria bacterium]|nr:CopG family transcriptional regulator [Candidatus Eisenbacteria bacterium]
MPPKKTEIISFKADGSLVEALKGVENRSNFIRAAVMSALDNSCPLCGGRGVLTPNQMRHWKELSGDHRLEKCEACSEVRLVCAHHGRD